MSDDPRVRQFESAYEGKPPWDLGKPQKPFVEIADRVRGSVLDAGCGTGDNALFFAERGHDVLGIDLVEAPLRQARQKAAERGIRAEFLRWDALRLKELGRSFDNVIDCGLFHVLSDDDRTAYVAALAGFVRAGGMVFLMCFSDEQTAGPGPRRISQEEIRAAFVEGWTVETITAVRFAPSPAADPRDFGDGGPKAWFAAIRREE